MYDFEGTMQDIGRIPHDSNDIIFFFLISISLSLYLQSFTLDSFAAET